MNLKYIKYSIILYVSLIASCASFVSNINSQNERRLGRMQIDSLKTKLQDYNWTSPQELNFYLSLYNLPSKDIKAEACWIKGNIGKIFALRLIPENAKGRILIVHGYISHSGHFADVASTLTSRGYEAWFIDLPGCGLSDGESNNIDSFHSYGEAVRAIIAEMSKDARAMPITALGHSTGCSAITDFVVRYNDEAKVIGNIILLAPLVRTTSWNMKLFATKLVGNTSITIARSMIMGRRGKVNKPFAKLLADKDPLLVPIYRTAWLKAVEEWDIFMTGEKPSPWQGKCMIVQGDDDDVVDGPYNLSVLSRIFTKTKSIKLKKYNHNIHMEPPARLSPIMEEIINYIEKLD